MEMSLKKISTEDIHWLSFKNNNDQIVLKDASKNGTIYDNIAPWYNLNSPFELAITGSLFDFIRSSEKETDKLLFKEIIRYSKVFAWMSPEGKANLVEAL